MTPDPVRPAAAGRTHYSYEHYADAGVAAGFDQLRFGGPIGGYLAEQQHELLMDALAPVSGRTVLDVGTGTGRAALALTAAGASVVGFDASHEMLSVARSRAEEASMAIGLGRADAHALPLPDRSLDAAVCFRVLMHALDWRLALAELCRVARWRVVIDFPSARSLAALQSTARRWRQASGRSVEAYRVMSERDVRREFEAHGFRVVQVRRQFVLPIAAHKAVGRLGVTKVVEGGLAAVGLLRLFGSPVTMVAER